MRNRKSLITWSYSRLRCRRLFWAVLQTLSIFVAVCLNQLIDNQKLLSYRYRSMLSRTVTSTNIYVAFVYVINTHRPSTVVTQSCIIGPLVRQTDSVTAGGAQMRNMARFISYLLSFLNKLQLLSLNNSCLCLQRSHLPESSRGNSQQTGGCHGGGEFVPAPSSSSVGVAL